MDLRRVAVACLALSQLGSVVALTHADALLDAERLGAAVHVESPDHGDCAIHHGHFFCQLVRSLSQAGVPRGITLEGGFAPPIRVVEVGSERSDMQRAPILFGGVSPRGPPTT